MNGSNKLDEGAVTERRALVTRVLNSPQFIRSSRQRELLSFICERALASENPELNEADIGHHVFGRPESYNPGDDNIVRVAARQLRTKLAEYFATDGRHEPLVVEIPKGAYLPVFHPAGSPLHPEPPEPAPRPRKPALGLAAAATVAAVLFAALATWAFLQNRSLRTEVDALRSPPTPLSELLFDSQNRVNIVVTDAGSQAVQNFAGRVVSVEDYAARRLPPLPEHTSATRFIESLPQMANTALADTVIAATIAEAAGRHRDSIRVRHAREVAPRDFHTENFVLLGGVRANPWTRLFENNLNFAFTIDPDSGAASISNRKPLAGELPLYPPSRPYRAGYGRIAVVPNLSQTGKVVLIAGTGMASTEGAGAFMLDPASLALLHTTLHAANLNTLKSFELLLEMETVEGTPVKARLLASRANTK
ncbi:hypothetical protein [uncultured Paludibaculum sp.]|uniref:hypothetical protein n=1 Tax=uncultured Paludibaculum sp. TaxID=1765020 RepID=UPI002AAC310A|nr:hypothetical protein [uncultured Paludibaculum sp.]